MILYSIRLLYIHYTSNKCKTLSAVQREIERERGRERERERERKKERETERGEVQLSSHFLIFKVKLLGERERDVSN